MITDAQLNTLAIFLGVLSMLLIVLYHFLEVNAKDTPASEDSSSTTSSEKAGGKAGAQLGGKEKGRAGVKG